MTKDLKKQRFEIDFIDQLIIQALRKRFEFVSSISKKKKLAKEHAIDANREQIQLKRMFLEYNKHSKTHQNYSFGLYYSIFRQIISSSILNHNSDLTIVCENKLNNYQYLKILLQYFGFDTKITFTTDRQILNLSTKKNVVLALAKQSRLWSDNKINSCFQVFIELPLLELNKSYSVLLAKTQFEDISLFEELIAIKSNKNQSIERVMNVKNENLASQDNLKIIGGTVSKLIL